MNIDTFTTAALADEFRLTVLGGRVQDLTQITPFSFGLEIFNHGQRHYLLLSAEPQAPRIHLQSHKPRRGRSNETPLLQLGRKYLKSATLREVEQPALERVLRLHFASKLAETALIIELLGPHSNLIFVDDQGRILSLTRPVPPQTTEQPTLPPERRPVRFPKPDRSGGAEGERVLLPHQLYTLPRPQIKLTANTLTVEVLRDVLARAPAANLLSKTLVTRLAGLSPLIAREVVYRAYGQVEVKAGEAANLPVLLEAIGQVYHHLEAHTWTPQVAFDKNERVEFFAPIALTHLPQAEPVASISKAVEAHLDQPLYGPDDGYAPARFPVHLAIEQAQKRLKRRLEKLAQDAAGLKNPDAYRQRGEAILAYSSQVRRGQTELEVMWLDDKPLKMSLDAALSPAQNAQKYFARYQKAKRAADIIPAQQEMAGLQLEYLTQLALDLEMAETRPEIDAVGQALKNAGLDKNFQKRISKGAAGKLIPAAAQPRRFTSPDGFTVWVGRNAAQNHELTFGRARPDDIWLHARGVPGSHVVISAPDAPPPKSSIEWTAGVAAYYSKARQAGRAIVSYTRRKYVRPIKGAPPGLVRIQNESTIRAAPFKPED